MFSSYATHTGLLRQNNEDYVRTDDELGLYLLADGMGGHNAGEVASALAVETAYRELRSYIHRTDESDLCKLLSHSALIAHQEIVAKAQADISLAGMGTTLVIAVVRNRRAYIVNIGDSRCYLYRSGCHPETEQSIENDSQALRRLTVDHTAGDRLLSNGVAISQIPRKQFHALTRSVGGVTPPAADFNAVGIRPGDMLLLCSDGLTDLLTDTEIEHIISDRHVTPESLATALVEAANANGGRDNISVILVAGFT